MVSMRTRFATSPVHGVNKHLSALCRLVHSGARRPKLSLNHFLQRGRVLALWREVLRATNDLADEGVRTDMRRFARDEFERNRHVTDIDLIRYLISTGKAQLDATRKTAVNSMDAGRSGRR